MRRLARHVFTMLSLLLCIAVCVLWVRGYVPRYDWFDHFFGTRHGTGYGCYVESNRGTMFFVGYASREWHHPGGPVRYGALPSGYDTVFGFGCGHLDPMPLRDTGMVAGFTFVSAPHWFLALLTAFPAARWTWSAITRRWRANQGRCTACGYDLRAHREGERCPECGAVNPSTV
jgi:hypothetical protein